MANNHRRRAVRVGCVLHCLLWVGCQPSTTIVTPEMSESDLANYEKMIEADQISTAKETEEMTKE